MCESRDRRYLHNGAYKSTQLTSHISDTYHVYVVAITS